jgi:MFS family permease
MPAAAPIGTFRGGLGRVTSGARRGSVPASVPCSADGGFDHAEVQRRGAWVTGRGDAPTTAPPADGATSTFGSLGVPAFRRIFVAGLVVFSATTSQVVARGWLARELTGTNAGLGGVLLAFGVAMVLTTPIGGVAADRFAKRSVMVVAQSMLLLSTLLVGLAVSFDVVSYWMVMAMAALQAMAFALFGPARMAFTAELVPPSLLTNGIVLTQMSSEVMKVVGPSIAGLVIAAGPWGLEAVFYGSSLILLVGTGLTLFLPPGHPAPTRRRRSALAEMGDGFRYVRSRPDISLLLVSLLTVVMVGFPFAALLPGVADELFDRGSGGFGILLAVTALGGLAAGLVTARTGARHDLWRWVQWTGLGFGVGLIAFGLAPTFLLAVVALVGVGAGNLAFQTTSNSLTLSLTDIDYHGRVQSLAMLGFGGYGIAALPLGMLADAVGLRPTLVAMGAVVLAIMVAFSVRRRRFRDRELVLDLG